MDTLFTTSIIINGETQEYGVRFQNEVYQFTPNGGNGTPFSLRREDDAWKLEGDLAPIAKGQAESALEHYLLSQH